MASHLTRNEPEGSRWLAARHLRLAANKIADAYPLGEARTGSSFVSLRGTARVALFPSGRHPCFLELNPWKRVILASYAAQFAEGWGRKARDHVQRYAHECTVKTLSWADCREWLGYHAGRGNEYCGAGGPITGKGADLLIVDDPIKTPQEANSLVVRQHLLEWWQSTAYTRLEPAAKLSTMTRWHNEDLAGHLISQRANGGEYWEVEPSLPALALDNDPLGRKPGVGALAATL